MSKKSNPENGALVGILRCLYSGKYINSVAKDSQGYISKKVEVDDKYIYYNYRCKNDCSGCNISPKVVRVEKLDSQVKNIVIENILNILFPIWVSPEDEVSEKFKSLCKEKLDFLKKCDKGKLDEEASDYMSNIDNNIANVEFNRVGSLGINIDIDKYYKDMKTMIETYNNFELNRLYQDILYIDVDLANKAILLRISSLTRYGKYKSDSLYKDGVFENKKDTLSGKSKEEISDEIKALLSEKSEEEMLKELNDLWLKTEEKIEIIQTRITESFNPELLNEYNPGDENFYNPNFIFYKITWE